MSLRSTENVLKTVSVAGAPIEMSAKIKSLGVVFDKKLTFDKHVAAVCHACYFHIRALCHMRSSLTEELAKTVACAIVGSRPDYCNSVLYGMSQTNFDKLQRVQNTLARVVTGTTRFDLIMPVLRGCTGYPSNQGSVLSWPHSPSKLVNPAIPGT